MKLIDVISNIDREIALQEGLVAKNKEKREKFIKLRETFPNANYESGHICLPDIWDKITCMRIENGGRFYYNNEINAKFLLGKKQSVDDLKIYTYPYINKVAQITTTGFVKLGNRSDRQKELVIFDYEKIIPDTCPKKKAFVRRIKLYLTRLLTRENLLLSKNSFKREDFEKLLLLK